MSAAEIVVRHVGAERQPVAIVDGFHPDPRALRVIAQAAMFGPAANHYPGLRAELPNDYFTAIRPALLRVLAGVFDHHGLPKLIDSSFSIVTTRPEALSVAQRLPHVDANDLERIALVHYLALENEGGTAFYRHRATGLEMLDPARASTYRAVLGAELMGRDLPAGYIAGSTNLFEQTANVEARFNRAVIYRSALLHSGVIPPTAMLSDDPATGRLTVTAFLQL